MCVYVCVLFCYSNLINNKNNTGVLHNNHEGSKYKGQEDHQQSGNPICHHFGSIIIKRWHDSYLVAKVGVSGTLGKGRE